MHPNVGSPSLTWTLCSVYAGYYDNLIQSSALEFKDMPKLVIWLNYKRKRLMCSGS